jgi:carboxypeptidase C (cathepsin A)
MKRFDRESIMQGFTLPWPQGATKGMDFMRLAAVVIAFTVSGLYAQEHQRPTPGAPATAETPPAPAPATPPVEKTSQTKHSIQIDGKTLAYTATAGTLILKKDDKPWASMFYVAYALDGVPDVSKRPITFAFNGGPGSSSVWLHMGALGPKRVDMGADGAQPAPPYRLVDNQDSALQFTDLVFIDPVTTGFSRAAPGEQDKQFHGFDGDLDSVSEFIRLYLTRSERWKSAKFLAGESYGTTRAAALSERLLDNDGIYLNGITLISTVLNFETISFAPGNDLPYTLFLPSYTAAAWYHKKLPKDLQGDLEKALGESRRFAGNEYNAALMKGDKLTAAERTSAVHEMARLTGLSEQFIEASNLRVSEPRFTKELLRDRRKTIGRYDSRLEGEDIDAAGSTPEYDPSYASVQGVFTAMFNDYVRTDLKYDSDVPYQVLTDKVQPWNYDRFQNRYVNVAEMLRQAMTQNPSLKVMIANGYYDLATPFFATEYTVNHIGLDAGLSNHISLTYCDAGHMLYTKQSCLDGLRGAMADFYQKALPASGPTP